MFSLSSESLRTRAWCYIYRKVMINIDLFADIFLTISHWKTHLFVICILYPLPECPFKPVHVVISSLTFDEIQDSCANFLGIHIILEVLHSPFVQRMGLSNCLIRYNC